MSYNQDLLSIITHANQNLNSIYLGRMLNCVAQAVIKLHNIDGHFDKNIEIELKHLLNAINEQPDVLGFVNNHRSLKEQLNNTIYNLRTVFPQLSEVLHQLELHYEQNDPRISPATWTSVPKVRDIEDTKRLTRFNEYLVNPSIKFHKKQFMFLANVCERLLSFHTLASTTENKCLKESSMPCWKTGEKFIESVLSHLETQPIEAYYYSRLKNLIIGLLECLFPFDKTSYIFINAHQLEHWSKKRPKTSISVYCALGELQHALKNEKSKESMESLLQEIVKLQQQENKRIDISDNDFQTLVTGQYVDNLKNTRNVCYSNQNNIFQSQKEDSEIIISTLSQYWQWITALLDTTSIQVHTALLILGSTSRGEREYYSDIECALIISANDTPEEQAYINTCLRLLDILVLRLNETPALDATEDSREGLRIDTSSIPTDNLHTGLMSVGKIDEYIEHQLTPIANGTHLITNNANYFSLLYARLVNEAGGQSLYQRFRQRISNVLQQPRKWDASVTEETFQITMWNMTLRETTAWLSYFGILNATKSESEYFYKDQPFSLKKLLLNPLHYFSRFLELFHSIKYDEVLKPWLTTEEQFAMAVSKGLLPHGMARLLQNILQYACELRNRLSQAAKKQIDEINQNDLEPIDIARIKLYLNTVLLPLQSYFKQQLNSNIKPDPSQTLFTIDFLNDFLNARKHLWNDTNKGWLLENLGDYPDNSGWSPHAEATNEHWLTKARSSLISENNEPTNCLLQGGDWGAELRYLKPTAFKKLFTNQGELKGEKQYSSDKSAVTQIGDCFIKISRCKKEEALLTHQVMIALLHHYLGIDVIAPGYPVRFTIKQPGLDKTYWAWVSEAQPGESIELIKSTTPECFEEVDPACFSEHFLFAFLTGQEDGSFRNFVRKRPEITSKKPRWICIDSGQAFVQPIREWGTDWKEAFQAQRNYIVLKSFIFLIEKKMQTPIDQKVLEKLSLLDIEQVIKSWTDAISLLNEDYKPIVAQANYSAGVHRNLATDNFINLPPQIIWLIKTNLHDCQSLLRTKTALTHTEILQRLDFRLINVYQNWWHKIEEKGGLQKFNFTELEPAAYKRMQTAFGQRYYSSRCFVDLKKLQHTTRSLAKKIKQPEIYFKIVNYARMKDSIGNPDLKAQRFMIEMRKLFSLSEVVFEHCDALTIADLVNIIKNSTKLHSLTIRHCAKITSLNWLIEVDFWKNNVIFRHCKDTLHSIVFEMDESSFSNQRPISLTLTLPNLSIFTLGNVHAIKHLQLDTPALRHLTIDSANILETIRTTSREFLSVSLKNLKQISATGITAIGLENKVSITTNNQCTKLLNDFSKLEQNCATKAIYSIAWTGFDGDNKDILRIALGLEKTGGRGIIGVNFDNVILNYSRLKLHIHIWVLSEYQNFKSPKEKSLGRYYFRDKKLAILLHDPEAWDSSKKILENYNSFIITEMPHIKRVFVCLGYGNSASESKIHQLAETLGIEDRIIFADGSQPEEQQQIKETIAELTADAYQIAYNNIYKIVITDIALRTKNLDALYSTFKISDIYVKDEELKDETLVFQLYEKLVYNRLKKFLFSRISHEYRDDQTYPGLFEDASLVIFHYESFDTEHCKHSEYNKKMLDRHNDNINSGRYRANKDLKKLFISLDYKNSLSYESCKNIDEINEYADSLGVDEKIILEDGSQLHEQEFIRLTVIKLATGIEITPAIIKQSAFSISAQIDDPESYLKALSDTVTVRNTEKYSLLRQLVIELKKCLSPIGKQEEIEAQSSSVKLTK